LPDECALFWLYGCLLADVVEIVLELIVVSLYLPREVPDFDVDDGEKIYA
jgi:hypothetical protein